MEDTGCRADLSDCQWALLPPSPTIPSLSGVSLRTMLHGAIAWPVAGLGVFFIPISVLIGPQWSHPLCTHCSLQPCGLSPASPVTTNFKRPNPCLPPIRDLRPPSTLTQPIPQSKSFRATRRPEMVPSPGQGGVEPSWPAGFWAVSSPSCTLCCLGLDCLPHRKPSCGAAQAAGNPVCYSGSVMGLAAAETSALLVSRLSSSPVMIRQSSVIMQPLRVLMAVVVMLK